jgi:hypothetical protein
MVIDAGGLPTLAGLGRSKPVRLLHIAAAALVIRGPLRGNGAGQPGMD